MICLLPCLSVLSFFRLGIFRSSAVCFQSGGTFGGNGFFMGRQCGGGSVVDVSSLMNASRCSTRFVEALMVVVCWHPWCESLSIFPHASTLASRNGGDLGEFVPVAGPLLEEHGLVGIIAEAVLGIEDFCFLYPEEVLVLFVAV